MNLSADTEMRVVEAPTRQVDLAAAGRLRLDTDVVYRIVSPDPTTRSLRPDDGVVARAGGRTDRRQTGGGGGRGQRTHHDRPARTPPHRTDHRMRAVDHREPADARVSEVLGCPVSIRSCG